MKRKIETEQQFAFLTMLQSVAWLNFSAFGGSLKIENYNQFSMFVFPPKHSKSLTKLTKREGEGEGEGEGVHSHGNFLPPAPSSHGQVRFFS